MVDDVLFKHQGVLLSSTTDLMEKMPEVVLASRTFKGNETEQASKSNRKQQYAETETSVGANLLDIGRGVSILQRSRLYLMKAKPLPPRFFIKVKIPHVSDNVKKGLFKESGFVSYTIETDVCRLDFSSYLICKGSQMPIFSERVEKRFSDFRSIQQQLAKQFPYLMIPSIPLSDSKEDNLDMRKRAFILWLQYLSNLDVLQSNPPFIQFLTGGEHLVDSSAVSNTANSSSKQYSKFQTPAKKATTTKNAAVCDSNSSDISIFTRVFAPLLTQRRDCYDIDDGHLKSESIYNMKVLAYQDLQTFSRYHYLRRMQMCLILICQKRVLFLVYVKCLHREFYSSCVPFLFDNGSFRTVFDESS